MQYVDDNIFAKLSISFKALKIYLLSDLVRQMLKWKKTALKYFSFKIITKNGRKCKLKQTQREGERGGSEFRISLMYSGLLSNQWQ